MLRCGRFETIYVFRIESNFREKKKKSAPCPIELMTPTYKENRPHYFCRRKGATESAVTVGEDT